MLKPNSIRPGQKWGIPRYVPGIGHTHRTLTVSRIEYDAEQSVAFFTEDAEACFPCKTLVTDDSFHFLSGVV